VINAFTSAAAITIACGQVKGILGLKDIPREFLHMVYETCKKIPETRFVFIKLFAFVDLNVHL
jgi:sodium-independent sulfate anion transporter 11